MPWQCSSSLVCVCPIRAETERGLSRKHIIEGKTRLTFSLTVHYNFELCLHNHPPTIWTFTSLHLSGLKGSLQRMQLEYVDVVFANRPDSNTPMEGESANQLCTWITNQLIWVASLSLVLRPQWVYDVGWQCWFMFRGYGLCCFAAGWVHSF